MASKARLSAIEVFAAPLSFRADEDNDYSKAVRIEPVAIVGPARPAALVATGSVLRCAVPPARLQVKRSLEEDPMSRAVQAQLGASQSSSSSSSSSSSTDAEFRQYGTSTSTGTGGLLGGVVDRVELTVRRLDDDWDRRCVEVSGETASDLRPDAVFGPAWDRLSRPPLPAIGGRGNGSESKWAAADRAVLPSVTSPEVKATTRLMQLASAAGNGDVVDGLSAAEDLDRSQLSGGSSCSAALSGASLAAARSLAR